MKKKTTKKTERRFPPVLKIKPGTVIIGTLDADRLDILLGERDMKDHNTPKLPFEEEDV